MSAFVLSAVDGSNPLGFLCALGTLRLSALHWPDHEITLRWQRSGKWTPRIDGVPLDSQFEYCKALLAAPGAPVEEFRMLGDNLTVPPSTMAKFVERADEIVTLQDRRLADFAAAFGSEALEDRNGRIEYTQLCFITGSGHQHFLGTIADLVSKVTASHLAEALFADWSDRQKGSSFRWNPTDARSYALRWDDPGPEGSWTTWGANRLAFEALPFFPTSAGKRLATVGFTDSEFSWPIWEAALSTDEVGSLLASPLGKLEHAEERRARGVVAMFQSSRVRIGQGANFKVSFRAARAI